MSVLPTDEELLSCPEAVELRFIHRGRRDIIAPQAGKEFLYFDLTRGERFFNFLSQATWSLAIHFSLKIGRFLSLLLVTCVP